MSVEQLTADEIEKLIKEKGLAKLNLNELIEFKRILRESDSVRYAPMIMDIGPEIRKRQDAVR